MGFFSSLFGSGDDNVCRLNVVPDTHEEHVDTIIQFTKFPDVRQALLEDPSLTPEQRKAMYKINNAYKGVEGQQTWKDWESEQERKDEEYMKRKNEEYKKRQEQEQESESRGWFGWF